MRIFALDMKVCYFFKSFWPSLLTLAVILYATLAPDPALAQDMPAIPHIDKLIHAIMLGGLFGAIVFDTRRLRKAEGHIAPLSLRFLLWLAVAVMAFSVLDEIMQKELTTNRSAEFLDLFADWVGIWIAFFAAPPAVRAVLRLEK